MQMSMTDWGRGSFLSYFLLVFKVVKIDGPSALPQPVLLPSLSLPSCRLSLLKIIFGIRLDRQSSMPAGYPLCSIRLTDEGYSYIVFVYVYEYVEAQIIEFQEQLALQPK